MPFLKPNKIYFLEKEGKMAGFIFSFFVFSTLLYFFLSLLNKLPEGWTIYNTTLITLSILAISYIIKKTLE